MCVRLDRHYIDLAMKLGLKSIGEYAVFVINLNNFYKGVKR